MVTFYLPVSRAFFLCAFLRDADKNPVPARRTTGRQLPIPRSFFKGTVVPFGALESAMAVPAFFHASEGQIQKEVPRMAKAGSRVKITLRCSECKQRNYNTNKNKRNTTERLELNKYCPFCRKHTLHTETK